MEFEITHVTHYKYGHTAAEAYGEARLTPPSLPSQTVLSHRLVIDPEVRTSGYVDHFGNRVDFFSLPFRHKQLFVSNQAVVRTHPVPRPASSLELPVQEARQILGSVMTDIFDYLQMTPAVQPTREAVQWAKKYLHSSAPLGESLQRLNEAIYAEFKYKPGSTENSTPLATIWKNKVGVCQDFAHIGLSILRVAGLPARYVCGYIETDPIIRPDGSSRRLVGAVATHAWIEVLVPGMSWVALDPTNRQWVGERHVAVSFGRDFRDATPLRGTFQRERRARDESARDHEAADGQAGESAGGFVNVRIQYQTQYLYEEPVSFSSHLFRLFPKADRYLSVRSLAFQTNAAAAVSYRRDLFDNEIASCFYPGNSALLAANLQIELEIQPRNAFGFLLAPHALDFPFTYEPREAHVLAPYRQTKAALKLPFWQPPATPQPTVEALVALNAALHASLAYERREEGAAYAPEETLRLGRGSCRDFTVLLAEVARGLGLAARLASGYLCEFGSENKVAEGALHAWTEIYLPGAGWVGFDPTNGYLCNHHHITAAVGLTPEDISPILGNYFHPTHVPAQMTTSLQIFPA